MTSRPPDLVERYRRNYGLGTEVTEEMVMAHWHLERDLTRQLLDSTPETRWESFDRAYSELYRALPWLREDTADDASRAPAEFSLWPHLVGKPPASVYEIGSGEGALARHLAGLGYEIRATEITRNRGDRASEHGVSWGQTDGVHLDDFEAAGSFDAVISNQVVEHLHPDDLETHLRAARTLLRPGGRLAFATPHAYTGPHDISRVFASATPVGMHLHEYTYAELAAALYSAGFDSVRAPVRVPAGVRERLGGWPPPRPSRAFTSYLIGVERLIAKAGHPMRRRQAAHAARYGLFAGNIMLVAVS